MPHYLDTGRRTLRRVVVRDFPEAMRGRVEPVHGEDVTLAAELADRYPSVSARDLVHAAVIQRLGTNRTISADTDLNRLEGKGRLVPVRIEDCHGAIPTPEEDSGSRARSE